MQVAKNWEEEPCTHCIPTFATWMVGQSTFPGRDMFPKELPEKRCASQHCFDFTSSNMCMQSGNWFQGLGIEGPQPCSHPASPVPYQHFPHWAILKEKRADRLFHHIEDPLFVAKFHPGTVYCVTRVKFFPQSMVFSNTMC